MSVVSAAPGKAGEAEQVKGRLQVGGLEVRYQDSVEDPGKLPPIVLVHGTGGSTDNHFKFLIPMLAVNQRVVAVDFATPQGAPEEGPALLAEQVLAVIEEVLPGRAVTLVGYSLGAVVAATAAAARPDLVGGLVLVAGWMKTDAQQLLRHDVWHALRPNAEALGRYQLFCAFSAPILSLLSEAERAGLAHSFRKDDDVAAQMEINRVVDLTDIAPRIECPTLIIAGTDDIMTPYRHSKQLFGAIPDARYTEVTSGHAVVVERPVELLHLIATFNADPHEHPAGTILPRRRP